ncbi:MAG: nucleotidyltransferase family protein [Acidobacteriota bacterium]
MEKRARLTLAICRPFLDRLITGLREKLGSGLEAVALFGSVARDQGHTSSDLDLLIVYRGDREPLDEFVELLIPLREEKEYQSLLQRGFYPEVMPLFMNLETVKSHPWILVEIADHGRILFSLKSFLENELQRIRERLRELGSRKVILEDGSWYWDLKPDWKPGESFDL